MKKVTVLVSVFAIVASLLFANFIFKPGYNVGDIVSDFSLKGVDEKNTSLTQVTSNTSGAIVIFDSNTCPYSKRYNDRIIALHKKYAPKGYPVVAINSNDAEVSPGDSFSDMVQYAKEKKYEFAYLQDETQQVAHAFGATNTPHVYVLKKQGNQLVVAYIGSIDDNARDEAAVTRRYVEEAVDALLANQPIKEVRTKAIGCTIKWRRS